MSLTKRLLNAKYALSLSLFGFFSAYLLNKNIDWFYSLSIIYQGVIVTLLVVIGFALIWKDRTQETCKGNKKL